MRVLAVLGAVLLVVVIGAAAYAYFGFYNIAASDPHVDVVRWSLERTQDNSVQRQAGQEVGEVPALDDSEMIRTGADHYRQEGCIQCHAGPGIAQAEFARHMRPEPPDLTEAASEWNDAELFWIVQHGIKMTGMPAFGPTHNEDQLWAMVAFVRRLPDMTESQFKELTASGENADHHGAEGSEQSEQQGGEAAHGESEHNGGDGGGQAGSPAGDSQ